MKKIMICLILASSFTVNSQTKSIAGYPITPVPFTAVKVNDAFWGQRLKANREVTIPLAFSKCEETGRYKNFERAAHPSDTNKVSGFPFDDTDVFKTIEGASYSMQTKADKKLDRYIDSVLVLLAAAQEPDGYLYTARTQNPNNPHKWSGKRRWEKEEEGSHELYNLGHLIEAAVAHYQATGKRNFLDIAIKYADCVCREVGSKSGQICVVPGHEIAEMALCKLYTVTGNKKYLDEAKFFIDMRGKTSYRSEYNQTQKPIVDQDEAVGHAVRAGYLYSGIADVAALTGDSDYINAIDKIWENVVSKKLYLTGGIGATSQGEAFGKNYDLPNATAYNETCAAISNVYWNYRLFLLHGDSKYFDVLERTLYNGLISGVSLDGGKFFYPNPLESEGGYEREPWFGCACCPSNICRFIPSIPGYIYAVKDKNLYVNLFMSNSATIDLNGISIGMTQITSYPWNGDVDIAVAPKKAGKFSINIRIPGWVKGDVVPSDLYAFCDSLKAGYRLLVNGEKVNYYMINGYACIERKWKKGDKISINFDMQPRLVKANPNVEPDKGHVAVERGPLVYCAEWPDNNFNILNTVIGKNPVFKVENKSGMLYGINTITTDAQELTMDTEGRVSVKDVMLTLIPYYAWAHRGQGAMTVWLAANPSATNF